ncbi:MAG: gamma-glutamyl-gamma-aminobutyrate hydrolase family protein [Phoenicibacter congonensis]|uniref:Gamma-glutamyl-gamma-aminobutyrate hydrolase family protein n=1 Tax=Phoenicibacter congonensis TaxID=1944646 RepID=A0AA43RKV3_9ACTN|nr:gamma-glutamyl-gamma-aminobutyrate hydrolase family protein [Phoenicibacter congonensis]
MRKVVGIIPLWDDEKESYWMLPGYMKMLEAQNAIPLMLPLTSNEHELDYFLEICGGFLLTGGHDVSPSVYHANKESWCGECCELRDEMEHYILKHAVDSDKSVLGICRGVQFMNACFGGTLYQDLATEHPSSVEHHMNPPYDRVAHQVTVQKGSPLHEFLGAEEIGVNSYHHQATMAISEDGLVESIFMPSKKFVVGVQWHPEFSYEVDKNSRKIVGAFVSSI